jgi:alpha-mannosidase
MAAYLFNSPLHGASYVFHLTNDDEMHVHISHPHHGAVRCHPKGGAVSATVAHPPFVVFGRDHNVILETIKRGDLDALEGRGPRTIVLRLYEAFGGHACVCLQINVPGVAAAYATNLLEDDAGAEVLTLEQTTGEWGEQPGKLSLRLAFRGFEAKTVKLVLAK